MKDQFRSGTKKTAEQLSQIQQKLGGQFARLRENLAALYWNRSPEQRQRIRMAAVAFAILSLGIVLGAYALQGHQRGVADRVFNGWIYHPRTVP